jgi:hypothetical protein
MKAETAEIAAWRNTCTIVFAKAVPANKDSDNIER